MKCHYELKRCDIPDDPILGSMKGQCSCCPTGFKHHMRNRDLGIDHKILTLDDFRDPKKEAI